MILSAYLPLNFWEYAVQSRKYFLKILSLYNVYNGIQKMNKQLHNPICLHSTFTKI